MSIYIRDLNSAVLHDQMQRNAEKSDSVSPSLKPLRERLARLLSAIPVEVQAEGMSISTLQGRLRGRWRGNAHPGELGRELRRLRYTRRRCLREEGYVALWFPAKD